MGGDPRASQWRCGRKAGAWKTDGQQARWTRPPCAPVLHFSRTRCSKDNVAHVPATLLASLGEGSREWKAQCPVRGDAPCVCSTYALAEPCVPAAPQAPLLPPLPLPQPGGMPSERALLPILPALRSCRLVAR